jgi:hypothetical protein
MKKLNHLDTTDRDNLNFIISTPVKKLNRWLHTLSEDERDYASNLMQYYSEWLHQQSSDFLQSQEAMLSDVSKWHESAKVLQSVMYQK